VKTILKELYHLLYTASIGGIFLGIFLGPKKGFMIFGILFLYFSFMSFVFFPLVFKTQLWFSQAIKKLRSGGSD